MLWVSSTAASLLDSDGRFRIEAAKQAVEGRLHLLPRFRQVLYVPRRGLGGPLWVDAPAFDLSDHVRVERLHAPADEADAAAGGRAVATAPAGQVTATLGDVVPHRAA